MAESEKRTRFAPRPADSRAPRRATRREQRAEASLPLTVCGFRSDGRLFCEVCSTRNVSRSGCRIHLRTHPQPDTALALRVIPEDASAVQQAPQLLFQVVWLEPEEEGWAVGAVALGDADLYHLAFPPRTP
jgi:hypothetical protein